MASLDSAAVESLNVPELLRRTAGGDSVTGSPDVPTIRVTFVQSGNRRDFSIVEKTIMKDGAWYEHDSTRHNLTMNGSDVSGILRFKSDGAKPEFFLVALGVDSVAPYRWCDLKFDVKPEYTGASIHQLYYNLGTAENGVKYLHKGDIAATTTSGTNISVKYYYDDGQNLRGVTITVT